MATKSAGEWGILIETEVAKIKRMKMVRACYSSRPEMSCVLCLLMRHTDVLRVSKKTIKDDDNNILVQYLKLAKELPFYGLVRLYPPPPRFPFASSNAQETQFTQSCVVRAYRACSAR
jgi:hypothetical protein